MNKRKYSIQFKQPTLTQQHSKDETDINKIMARYIKTGVIDHVAKYQPQYLDNTDIDYHQSQNIIIKADGMFSDLPATVRKEFNNNPAEFLEFVNDPDNHEKLKDLVKPPITGEKPLEKPVKPPKKPAPAAVTPSDSTKP